MKKRAVLEASKQPETNSKHVYIISYLPLYPVGASLSIQARLLVTLFPKRQEDRPPPSNRSKLEHNTQLPNIAHLEHGEELVAQRVVVLPLQAVFAVVLQGQSHSMSYSIQ